MSPMPVQDYEAGHSNVPVELRIRDVESLRQDGRSIVVGSKV